MRRAWAVLAAGVTAVALALLPACPAVEPEPDAGSEDSFVEPGRADGGTDFAFCPTTIDVFGSAAATLEGCGGVQAEVSPTGLLQPGDAGYDGTLAGRLRARLLADPELVARFGEAWSVRSCARRGPMGAFVRSVPPAECPNAGNTGDLESLCTEAPAPLVLFDASNLEDRCHGGAPDSTYEDDREGFAEHWSQRFGQFLAARSPQFLLVAPQLDWQPLGSAQRPQCAGVRSSWSPAGALRWRTQHPDAGQVRRISVLQEEFERHHPCCAERGVACAESWYPADAGAEADGWTTLDCRGAERVVDAWFEELRGYLLANRFSCGG